MITGIRKIAIQTSDLNDSLAFFSETLDLPILRDLAWRGKADSWELGFGTAGTTLALIETVPGETKDAPGQATIVLETDDINADYAALQAKGASLDGPPAMDEYDGMVAYLTGPDGVRIALLQPRDWK